MNGMIRRFGVSEGLAGNPEFQSALVRLTACLLGALYIAVGASTQYYRVDVPYYLTLFGIYLVSNIGFLVSIALRSEWPARVYLGICLDVVAISLAIFITREAISPFYLLYILVFISAGTRFGKHHLVVASLAAVFGYNVVLIALDEWRLHTFEATFFLALLVLLPLYQYSLLRKVQDARAEAERANQARGDFLAFMTHELRTPLTGVVGMTELLRGTRLDDEQRDCVQAIANSADILGALIGDILDLSKIDAHRIVLERIPFDPRSLVRDVSDALAMRAYSAGLELIADVDPNVPPRLIGDPLRLRQILFNLMGNALKFADRGAVTLEAWPVGGTGGLARILFSVSDEGIGIPADKLNYVFESFTQVDGSYARRYQGTGLGLPIVRRLVALMGGRISVDSAQGEGTTIHFVLPLKVAPQRQAATKRRLETISKVRPLQILLVEDDVVNLTMAKRMLEKMGHAVICARNGAEALDCLHAPGVDLVLMDIQMPEMDGIEATRQIRKKGFTDIPIVAMTANAMKGDREKCLEAGMNDYISKPIKRELVFKILAERLYGHA